MKIRSPIARRRTRLEIIPLIDIMFFLLASFMMISLQMQIVRTVKASLPTATLATSSTKPDIVNLLVNRDGQVSVDKKVISLSDLNTLLTSGYEVVSNNRTPGPLDTPQIAGIDNSVSGQLTVRGGAVLNGRMYQLQFSLDNLSLMALTISTGFVVDDAIVVIENITRYLEEGMSPFQAAMKGAREISFTVLSISISLRRPNKSRS